MNLIGFIVLGRTKGKGVQAVLAVECDLAFKIGSNKVASPLV